MKNKKTINKKLILTKFIGLCAIILGLTQVIIANHSAASGIRVANFDREIETLTKENKIITNKIAQNTSLIAIEKKAVKLGFVKADSYIFLSGPLPVAYKK